MSPRNRLLVLSGGHLLNDGAANYLPGVLPAVLVALGAPKSQAGVLMGALLIGQGLQPVIGYASDHIGGKIIALGGMCGATVAGALIGLAPNYWTLILLLLVLGVANSCFHPQALAGVKSLAGSRRGLSTSTFLIGGEIGRGVWPFLGGLVVAGLGLSCLWLLALPLVVCLPLFVVSFPSMPPRGDDAPPIQWRAHLGPLARVVTFTSLRITLIFVMITYLPLWWQDRGGGVVGGSALVMVLYVVGIVGNAAGGHFADEHGFRRVAALVSATSIGLLALFMAVNPAWLGGAVMWGVLSLVGISLFATLPISVALGQDVFPENPSLGAGVALGFCNALGAVLVLVIGLFVNWIGVKGVLWVNVGLSVAALASAFVLPSVHGQHEASDDIGEQTTDAALESSGTA